MNAKQLINRGEHLGMEMSNSVHVLNKKGVSVFRPFIQYENLPDADILRIARHATNKRGLAIARIAI